MSNSSNFSSASRSVLAAVIERNGRYLICLRPAHKHHGGLWEFPGGKLEDGETFLMTAKRELSEELALNVISIGRTRMTTSDDGGAFAINFVDVEVSGEPQLLEHADCRWVSAAELLELPLAPSDKLFAESLTVSL